MTVKDIGVGETLTAQPFESWPNGRPSEALPVSCAEVPVNAELDLRWVNPGKNPDAIVGNEIIRWLTTRGEGKPMELAILRAGIERTVEEHGAGLFLRSLANLNKAHKVVLYIRSRDITAVQIKGQGKEAVSEPKRG